jgi:hypothetical protein
MADKKISALETIVTVDTGTDLFPIVDSSAGVTKKITPTALKTALSLDNVNNTSDLNKPISTATQDALDNRVIENAPITPGTAAKITFDAKGLVTSGDSLEETDLPTGINANKIGTGVVSTTEFEYLNGVTSAIQTQIDSKQATLVSGTNIKTINGTSLVGSGDVTINTNASGVSGAIQFSDGSALASDASNLFWDDTNNRLGVGTNSPSTALDLRGSLNIRRDGTNFTMRLGNLGQDNCFIDASNNNTFYLVDATFSNSFALSNVGIGLGVSPIASTRVAIKGTGSTSATTSLLVQNSAGAASLQVTDDGSVYNLGKNAIASNTAFGRLALIANTTGTGNTAMGQSSLNANNTGVFNTAFGFSTMYSNQNGTSNVAVGYEAAFSNVFSSGITAIGYQSLRQAGGANNTAIGHSSLFNNSGANNTAVGYESARANSSSTGVTAIGYQSLLLSTGENNTALGFQAGDNITTGAGNVCIGSGAKPLSATANNQFVVGSSTINAGSVTTESNLSLKVWNVIINGVAQKILLA